MTTKHCPRCRSECVVPLRSINRKICNDCKHEFDWNLSDGQVPVITSNRATRKAK